METTLSESLQLDIANKRVSELTRQIKLATDVLGRIERWHGEFPETGESYPDGKQVSYGGVFGSNGERDFMRALAREVRASIKGGGVR